MKIAWLTPFSRQSAIGQCSAMIIEELQRREQVSVFASDLADRQEPWLMPVDLHCISTVPRNELLHQLDEYDLRVYNLGNDLSFHRDIYELAVARPGITVLHDLVMHHFFAGYYLQYRHDPAGYVAEVAFSHGEAGARRASSMLTTGEVPPLWERPEVLQFNLARSALTGSDGVIVHSQFARRAVAEFADVRVVQVPFPAPRLSHLVSGAGWPTEPAEGRKVRLLTVGVVNPTKMLAEAIMTIGASPYLRERVIYDILGPINYEHGYIRQLQAAIAEHHLDNVVTLLGERPTDELHNYLRRADLVLNLRNPHTGESSWSLLETSFVGKASVVWKHGSFDEYPDDSVAKVASLGELASTLEELCRDYDRRVTLGNRARAYALDTFSTERYADLLIEFAQRVRYDRPLLRLTDTVADLLVELGCTSQSPLTARMAEEISAIGGEDGPTT